MRKVILGLLAVLTLCGSPAYARNNWVDPIQFFMAPDFEFKQIDTICTAPVLDLRSDKTAEFSPSERGPKVDFSRVPTADQVVPQFLTTYKYQTTACPAVNATLNDLRSPSDAWLRSLNFGKSNWLLVVAVEYLQSEASWIGAGDGYAIVSGSLFEKQASSARLVWRDRVNGIFNPLGLLTGPSKSGVREAESYITVNTAIEHLIARFESRRSHPGGLNVAFTVDRQDFASPCDRAWSVLKDTLTGDPKKYRDVYLDEQDRMALFTMLHIFTNSSGKNEDHVVLRSHEGKCTMEATQSYGLMSGHSPDWGDLTKQMRATLGK